MFFRGIKATLVAAFISASALASGAFAVVTNVNAELVNSLTRQPNGTWIETYSDGVNAIGPLGEVYKNNTTFLGTGVTQDPGGPVSGPAGNNIQTLHLLADDLQLDPASVPGTPITLFQFSVVNFNSAAASVRPHVTFYLNDGASGGPGTIVGSFLFNPITVNALTASRFNFTVPTANQFVIPANRFFWAGESFDNGGGATATNAQLDNFGQGIWNPPTIGTSADNIFESTNPDDAFSNNPVGTQGNFNGNPVANLGWELRVAVPEPGTLSLAGLSLLGLAIRRRRA